MSSPTPAIDEDEIYYDAFNQDWDDPDMDYLDELDLSLFPPPTAELPALSTPPSSASASFYEGYTATLRDALPHNGLPLQSRVRATLDYMRAEQGLNLELFLDALFWGDAGCISDARIKHERTVFMRSPTLLSVLSHWWCPPTSEHAGGGEPMKDFVMARATQLLEDELHALCTTSFRPPPDPLSRDNLTRVNFRTFGMDLQMHTARRLWLVLQTLACTPRQRAENVLKNPFHVIPVVLCVVQITHECNADCPYDHLDACILAIP